MAQPMSNIEFAAGLRAIADFYENNPEMKQPTIGLYCFDKTEFLSTARALSRGGKITKQIDPATDSFPYFRAWRDFAGLRLEVRTDRSNVCRMVRPAEYECPESLLEEFDAITPQDEAEAIAEQAAEEVQGVAK